MISTYRDKMRTFRYGILPFAVIMVVLCGLVALERHFSCILIMILLIFFIVTMFMESIATLTLFMPILYPIALGVGINPIVLSVLITVVIGVGLVTPPVGMCIYVACDLMDVTVGEVFPTLVPFIAATFVCIALMVAFPQLILLPTYLMA